MCVCVRVYACVDSYKYQYGFLYMFYHMFVKFPLINHCILTLASINLLFNQMSSLTNATFPLTTLFWAEAQDASARKILHGDLPP